LSDIGGTPLSLKVKVNVIVWEGVTQILIAEEWGEWWRAFVKMVMKLVFHKIGNSLEKLSEYQFL
jgi:hypothetical protein